MPGGGVAQIHQGKLKVYTSDPALVVAAEPPAPPPADQAAAEAEIAGFMVDLIVNEDIEATLAVHRGERLGRAAPVPTENLIVWTTPLPRRRGGRGDHHRHALGRVTQSYLREERPVREEDHPEPPSPKLDEDNPLRVWSYNANGLAEIEGDTAAKARRHRSLPSGLHADGSGA